MSEPHRSPSAFPQASSDATIAYLPYLAGGAVTGETNGYRASWCRWQSMIRTVCRVSNVFRCNDASCEEEVKSLWDMRRLLNRMFPSVAGACMIIWFAVSPPLFLGHCRLRTASVNHYSMTARYQYRDHSHSSYSIYTSYRYRILR